MVIKVFWVLLKLNGFCCVINCIILCRPKWSGVIFNLAYLWHCLSWSNIVWIFSFLYVVISNTFFHIVLEWYYYKLVVFFFLFFWRNVNWIIPLFVCLSYRSKVAMCNNTAFFRCLLRCEINKVVVYWI